MEKVKYDHKPNVLTKVGDGSYRYAWDIQTITIEMADMEPINQFTANEVIVWSPITSNSITEAVITALWDASHEQKLVNEYQSAIMGLYDEVTAQKKVEAYKAFLIERQRIKEQIDRDCAKFGIR